MTSQRKASVHFTRTTGRLPAWLWRDMYTARDNAKDVSPAPVVEDASQTVVIIPLDDYNRIIDAVRKDATHEDV